MGNSKLSVEEVMDRIKTAMHAKAGRTDNNIMPQSSANQSSGIENSLRQLDMEVRNNNQRWNIKVEQPITSHRRIIGPVLIFGRRLVQKYLRWYINPPFDQQREFNGSITRSINVIRNIVHAHDSKIEAQQSKINAYESIIAAQEHAINQAREQLDSELSISADRLRRIERRLNEGRISQYPPITLDRLVKEDKEGHNDIDYFLFEQRYRGNREDIKRRQKIYVDHFKGKSNVLDLGCGRGEFVELLIENGIKVTGIDSSRDMVLFCKEKGLPVIESDLFEYLNTIEDDSVDGIFAAQVIEHLTPDRLLKFIKLAYTKLKPAGTIVLETINPQCLTASANWFYMDLSHVKPVHPLTIQFIFEAEGFKSIQLKYLNPITDRSIPKLTIEGVNGNLEEFNQAVEKLNQFLYGPQDYAIIGTK